MPDESLLRDQARYAIRSGKLPSRQPIRTWGGPGVGVVCIICDQPVAQDQMELAVGFAGDETMREAVTKDHLEFEVQFARDGDNPGLDKFHIHVRCFAAWEFERIRDGRPHS
jgi:hypothetical protein